ncbi:Long-chain-fatty-acid--CoA ligase [Pseudovibrio axinellae]|uniref:Long-chain-fatty-acid--CoA ligase n=1 Tax=Pseudovibrio axinellae TaxID=989403 RepID=A0A165UMF7_9HYPH|nr:AMP-binding protein [Pseudovibrio axinellae]KZL12555.1 Long-chain-fatty-acid--CoA ligase [Pseudovibrio axinellae]SEP67136.1 long-chain acyl-CoA synthetase [Pseudovibrio axinellae]
MSDTLRAPAWTPTVFTKPIDTNAYRSVIDIFEEANSRFSDHVAFTNSGQSLTFKEVDEKSQAVAAYLQNELGLKKGDRVAIMLPNILAFPVVMFGILRAGLVQVNVNPLYTPRELKHQLNDADTNTIFVFSGSSATLAEIIEDTPVKNVVIANVGDASGANLPSPPAHEMFTDRSTVNDIISVGERLDFEAPVVSPTDLIFLQYTGGTTGLSKGAALSHGNLVANIMQFDAATDGFMTAGEEIVITALPLYHIFALMVNCLSFYWLGSRNVLITNPRDMLGFVAELKNWKLSVITGVNTLFNGLLHTPGFDEVDFSNYQFAMGGGSAIQRAISDKWKLVTGHHIIEGYGLSETSPILSVNPFDSTEFTETVGQSMPMTEIKLLDSDDQEVPLGQPGELCARGPQIMQGYWRKPEATSAVMTQDGFFRTGDIAIMDRRNNFKIVDRKKDMVLVSGFNVYPAEVEAVIAEIPGVVEVAVAGASDERTGEAVKAFVVRSNDSVTPQSVQEYCHDALAAYKVPKQVEFLEELPKSTVGKILRRELRDR